MDIITVDISSFIYPSGTKALTDISLGIAEGTFVTLCGASGSGKSTLLRLMKQGLAPRGRLTGSVLYRGTPLDELDPKLAAEKTGFVMQRPEEQIVTDKVWHELAFSLESTGVPQGDMRRRTGEMAGYFGLEDRFFDDTAVLSGGQKQLLALAGAVAVHPDLLLLDEPTSRLDPISARELIDAVTKLNRDFGVTVVIAEHRLEELLQVSDRIIVMEEGRIVADAAPSAICDVLPGRHPMMAAMPVSVRLFSMGGGRKDAPLTVRDGRNNEICRSAMNGLARREQRSLTRNDRPLITTRELWVSYGRKEPDVLRNTSLEVYGGEVLAVLGGNGSGKTTLLKCLSGALRPLGGRVSFKKDIVTAYLPQEPCELFRHDTVREELSGEHSGLLDESLYERHPYDLSGGEQQRLAIAVLLQRKPDVLLLDEPTKGMDAVSKKELAAMLRDIAENGTAVVLVTHDTELAAESADVCAMLFGGEIVSVAAPDEFFAENYFYTTPARRITRGIVDGITVF